MDQVTEPINQILSMNTSSAIIKIILSIVVLGCTLYYNFIDKRKRIESARKEEAETVIKEKEEIREHNNQQTSDLASDSQASDDFLKEK